MLHEQIDIMVSGEFEEGPNNKHNILIFTRTRGPYLGDDFTICRDDNLFIPPFGPPGDCGSPNSKQFLDVDMER